MPSNLLLTQIVQSSLRGNTESTLYQSDRTEVACFDYTRFTFRISNNTRLDTFTLLVHWYNPAGDLIYTDTSLIDRENLTLFEEYPVRGYSVRIILTTDNPTPPVDTPYTVIDLTAIVYKIG